jgi:diacylglycerol kinase family enzyme
MKNRRASFKNSLLNQNLMIKSYGQLRDIPPLTYLGIYNGCANGGSSIGQFSQIEKELISPCIQSQRYVTRNLEELDQVLMDHSEYQPDIVGIGGGDGTIHRILTQIYQHWKHRPQMYAIYSLGTSNLFSAAHSLGGGVADKLMRDIYLPTVPVRIARSIKEAAESGGLPHTQEIRILDANGEKGSIIGFGGVPKVMWKYYHKTHEQYDRLTERLANAKPEEYAGILAEIWKEPRLVEALRTSLPFGLGTLSTKLVGNGLEVTLNGLLDLLEPEKREHYVQPLPFRAYVDGKEVDLPRAHSILISTVSRLKVAPGFSIYPLEEQPLGLDRFSLLFCSYSLGELFQQVPNLMRGKKLEKHDYYQPKKLNLVSDQPIVGMIDGDFVVMDKEVEVQVADVSKLVVLPQK